MAAPCECPSVPSGTITVPSGNQPSPAGQLNLTTPTRGPNCCTAPPNKAPAIGPVGRSCLLRDRVVHLVVEAPEDLVVSARLRRRADRLRGDVRVRRIPAVQSGPYDDLERGQVDALKTQNVALTATALQVSDTRAVEAHALVWRKVRLR